MKKTFLLILFFCSHYVGIGQNWTSEELEKANTAANIPILTAEEKDVIKYINLARLYPQKFADIEVKDYLGPAKWRNYLKTSTYKESLLATLQQKRPVGALYFNHSMYQLAECFAKESGESGKRGHDRITCPEGYSGECISYGLNQAKDIALQLLIDHNVPSLGHREICLDGLYDKIGVSIKPHTVAQYCCVLDFKKISIGQGNNEPRQNKSKTQRKTPKPSHSKQ